MAPEDIHDFFCDDDDEDESVITEEETSEEEETEDIVDIEDDIDDSNSEEDEVSDVEKSSEVIKEESKEVESSKPKKKPGRPKGSTKKETQTKVEYPTWALPLKRVDKSVGLKVESFHYVFQRVLTPDEEAQSTNYFLVYCKNKNDEDSNYKTLSGLLSDRYIVIDSEQFINEFKKDLNIKDEETTVFEEPFYCQYILEHSEPISVDEIEDETQKKLIALVSGIDYNRVKSVDRVLKLDLINNYSGSLKLTFTPIVEMKITSEDNEDIKFNDHFSLLKYSAKVSHKGDFSGFKAEIDEIKDNIPDVTKKLREITDGKILEEVHKAIAEKLPKKNREEYESGWEHVISPNQQNLLCLLLYTSFKLSFWNISIPRQFELRSIVGRKLRNIL